MLKTLTLLAAIAATTAAITAAPAGAAILGNDNCGAQLNQANAKDPRDRQEYFTYYLQCVTGN